MAFVERSAYFSALLYPIITHSVPPQTPDVNEVVLGNVPKLPGCNPVTATTKEAKKPQVCSIKTPSLFSSPSVYNGTVVPPGSKVVKGYILVLLLLS